MKKINVEVSSDSRFPVDRKRIRSVVQKALKGFGASELTVSVRVVGDRKMKQLNKQYRNLDETTDVLSFPTEDLSKNDPDSAGKFVYPSEEAMPLGDIVISYPKARDYAAENNRFVNDEIEILLKHGVGSLLGQHS